MTNEEKKEFVFNISLRVFDLLGEECDENIMSFETLLFNVNAELFSQICFFSEFVAGSTPTKELLEIFNGMVYQKIKRNYDVLDEIVTSNTENDI